MRSKPVSRTAASRFLAVLLVALLAITACQTATPEDGSAEPAATTTEASPTPTAKTMCASGADLAVDVAFLRNVEVSEDGLLSLIVSVDAALGEARTLGPLVVEEYQPLVADVVVSLQELRDIAEKLEELDTLGEGIVAIGEAITEVGVTMDALATQLREPCPEEENE